MIKVDNFRSILEVETAFEAFSYETSKPNLDISIHLQHLKQYKVEIDSFARKYEYVHSFFSLPELEKRKALLASLREMLKSNRATNEELLVFFRKLPEAVQTEYRTLAVNANIKNLEDNLRKLLLLKAPNDKNASLQVDKNATLLDKQIDWLAGEIAKYKTQEFIFRELLKLKPKIDTLIEKVIAKASPQSIPESKPLGKTDINDLWWEQRSAYEGIFQDMKKNIANYVFVGKMTPVGGILNDRVVKIEAGTKPINAHFAFEEGKYIQTACPREYTVIDFYKMIQEQSCSTVVMLNELKEYSHFIPYWPTELKVPQYFGQTEVILLEHTEIYVHSTGISSDYKASLPSIASRKVRVSSPGNSPRIITLFQYHNWPDGKKADVVTTNKLIDMIDQNQQGKKTPIVIHCGAGMGRTGTFTAILKIANDLKEGKKDLKVRDAVIYQRSLETGRGGGMVGEEQYIFCHEVLQHRLLSSLFE